MSAPPLSEHWVSPILLHSFSVLHFMTLLPTFTSMQAPGEAGRERERERESEREREREREREGGKGREVYTKLCFH